MLLPQFCTLNFDPLAKRIVGQNRQKSCLSCCKMPPDVEGYPGVFGTAFDILCTYTKSDIDAQQNVDPLVIGLHSVLHILY